MPSEASSSVTSMREVRRSRARRAAAKSGLALSTFIALRQLALDAAAKSSRTVRSYTDPVRAFCRFLPDQDMPASVEDVDASHIRSFLLAEEQRTSAASAAVHSRNIRVFFGWLASEGERERENPNPMDRVEAPKVTKKATSFFTEEELARLLKTCSGATFTDRRDTAIMHPAVRTA
jgi:site-specific recombinase XerD